MKLSPRQYCALDSQRNWVVSTGAGAGKTSVLTERYVSLLEQHPELTVRNILELTFTQKAAEEMKARIYQRIHQLIAREKNEGRSQGKALQRWLEIKDDFSNNSICTFHAFCFQILRQKPIEAQLDPNLAILSEAERRNA